MLYFFNNISLFFSFLGCILPVSDLLFVVNFLICTDNVFSLQRFHFHYVVFIVLFSMPLIVLVSQDYQFTIWWVFSLLLLCMFVLVLFVSICKVLILFFVMHVFFLIILIFSYWFFISVFGSFLFSRAIYQEASNRQIFFPFAVMHVCFITIYFYLQGFIFVCCYACFLLN